ncbi:Por secretion system C-terminal sorting domain-containing protein [Arachidicoccus rhizosphaerae]|uniref:Por secretion system C-terminal sorting domain-containing protein n=1 Tax=Arachidicoccus rhizosphaerae TaxID=551991 RepID=A0A1H3XT04_9BACT|nr:T9SS type A sorting domain-containing protein [Arachidicoccus rhizosphaerae]SEA01734.1 Por secretion system C-terminal sorting domain-containing protein [Arachidicoccus rhizosphaerae]
MKPILLFILGLCCSLCTCVQAQTVYYVKTLSSGLTGTSWSDALGNLQDAINMAAAGDQIWVAKGSYYGNNGSGYGVVLKEGVSIYGGFLGTESQLSDRDPATNVTSIIGDYATGFIALQATNFNLGLATQIDGLTISGNTSLRLRGIFLSNVPSSLKINNCIIKDFFPIIPANDGLNGYGGGIYMNNSSPVITNCSFSNNKSGGNYGGAVYILGGNPEFINCSFLGNNGATGGGAVYSNGASAIYTHCIFKENTLSSLNSNYGGALYLTGGSSVIDNCLFTGNTAGNGGAALYVFQSELSIQNCTITNNEAANATGGGAIMYSTTDGSQISIANSIIWNNPSTYADQSLGLPEIQDRSIDGSSTAPVAASSIIKNGQFSSLNLAPVFVDGASGDFHLAANSPGIDAGDNSLLDATLDATDLAGNMRIVNGNVDLGAYESVTNLIHNNGDNTFNGFNGALDITGNDYENNLTNTFKWKMVITNSTSAVQELEVDPNDLAAYSLLMTQMGIAFDATHFQVADLTVMPTLLSIITGESDWSTFSGEILITRVVYPGQVQADSVESNSELITIASTLPVTLKDFTGVFQEGAAALQWHTAIETGFDHFELEKSTNAKSFTRLTDVQAQGSNSTYTLQMPQTEQKAYYRLKLVNKDGTSAYFEKLVEIVASKDGEIKVYPNPATTALFINLQQGGVLRLYDAAGRLVHTVCLKEGLNKVNISKLSRGIYFGQIEGGPRFKVVKQ